ncbi:hypothetical protein CL634_03190 [bacterium]|nr:hypothetical protein [bacterium]|tara:strand:+ start:290 stop:571 length:282 start_codon:yes stop_codon:yes gene_type:complete
MDIEQKLNKEENTEETKPEKSIKGKRGRPPFKVDWPEGEFTADEVYQALNKKLSKVSIHTKIKIAMEAGELVTVGKVQPKTGRPKSTYKVRMT